MADDGIFLYIMPETRIMGTLTQTVLFVLTSYHMNSRLTLLSPGPASYTIHARGLRSYVAAIIMVAAIVAAAAANAQISSINSAVIIPRVFNDIPSATLTDSNNYPASISITESNVSRTSGFANRDVWYFSANGTTPYLYHSNDYFYSAFSVTLTGGTPGFDLEAGYLFKDPSGVWGGDLQSLVTASGVVVQFGGPSYYPFSKAAGGYPGPGGSVSNYVEGETYTFGLNYLKDPVTGLNAFQYSVNGQYAASSTNGDRYFDIGTNAIGHPGDFLGGYLQIQRTTNTPGNMGTVVFSDISINPAVPPGITCPAPVEVVCPQPAELTAVVHNASGLPLDVVWDLNGTAVQTNALPATNAATDVPVLFSAVLPLGTNAVGVSVSDAFSNLASCATLVTVVDTNPPVIVSASATPNVLWPPNHQLVPVDVTASVTDECDSADWMIVDVSSNEPGQGHGPDWIITGPHTLLLRAERFGYKPRVYFITIQATDSSGNLSAPEVITVTVPRSARYLPHGPFSNRPPAFTSPDQE